jgi:hypothetical protein
MWPRLILGLCVGAIVSASVLLARGGDKRQEKEIPQAPGKNEEKEPKGKDAPTKTGTVTGVLVDRTYGKGVLVQADGEETPRRYWRFGDRADLNKQIDAIPLGSRVRLTWEVPHANEGPHVAKIELLKAPGKEKDKP